MSLEGRMMTPEFLVETAKKRHARTLDMYPGLLPAWDSLPEDVRAGLINTAGWSGDIVLDGEIRPCPPSRPASDYMGVEDGRE